MKIVKVFHADHGVSPEMMEWAVRQIEPHGFFLRTLELPSHFGDLENGLYGPASGDDPVDESEVYYAHRGGAGRGASRMIDLPKRPTRLLTIIGMEKDNDVTVFTAYGGPAAEREPTDPSIANDAGAKAAAKAFWDDHALASGNDATKKRKHRG